MDRPDQESHHIQHKPGSFIAGRYEIVRTLGEGGMASVFEVIDHSLNGERLALKLFTPMLANDNADPTLLARFRNEVAITRKLTHPGVVRTYEFGESADEGWYMTMEFVDGATLEQLIEHQIFGDNANFQQVSLVLSRLADAIDYAHRMGVVHRDLKPANILLSRSGEVKISDFGLARLLTTNQRLTRTGLSVGTPMYMSPEQIKGQIVDHRSDIYALGLIAYELVTGHPAFSSDSWYELASKIVESPTPVLTTKPRSVPVWFQELIQKATAKDRDQRFSSASEIRDLINRQGLPCAVVSAEKLESEPPKVSASLRTSLNQAWIPTALFAALLAVIGVTNFSMALGSDVQGKQRVRTIGEPQSLPNVRNVRLQAPTQVSSGKGNGIAH
jgi:serine/threonine-protein kinase